MTEQMLAASLIRQINQIVKQPWTKKELDEGKTVPIHWEDIVIARAVIPKFISKGWVIKKKEAMLDSSGRKMILYITKPPFEDFIEGRLS